jgi:putative flippase GtrA
MFKNKQFIFFLVGGWNTLFGYFSALLIYHFTHSFLHILLIGIITNILSISMSFFTYKYFVFKTTDHWLREYFRSYLVYGVISLITICILWIAVDYLQIKFWITQGLIIPIAIVLSYLGHNRFTFKNKNYE